MRSETCTCMHKCLFQWLKKAISPNNDYFLNILISLERALGGFIKNAQTQAEGHYSTKTRQMGSHD